ncbi:MAG: hypothetical protein OMM_01487 [Candidatus Magnetoglobus multicellularis str. Araruama]|uniref:YhcG PDDEXK nuclease domain-containing protein n=1 Tax=Candidatus Magnetoglobus multicellularis str. Araruama TaxID=890399 RepID=A0A1V1PD80_9BACT|nr:MAG: hypothetical protein OMM_01487 [Candidatus Magnetoglobus multicellularis str. Araruama]
MSIKSLDERRFYEIEACENSWGIRELKRQISSSLYERLALSRDKEKIKELSEKGQVVDRPKDILKNPYVLEFLELEEHTSYSEHQLETAIINKIEHFLLELGKGFLFEARQKRFTFDDDHFYVDYSDLDIIPILTIKTAKKPVYSNPSAVFLSFLSE